MKKVKKIEDGIFTAELAAKLGRSQQTIVRWMRQLKIKMHYMTSGKGQPHCAITQEDAVKVSEIARMKDTVRVAR